MTARAKGLTEHQVLYGHVFRNAMLIVIAGFPGAFIGAFFAGSLLIETIFSLDGLGLLGFELVVNRDYPVVFATLYIFSLLGLVIKLISDLTYTGSIRASISRRARSEPMDAPIDTASSRTVDGRTASPVARLVALAAQPAAARDLQGQPARLLVAVDLPRPVRSSACSPSSSPTTGRSSSPTRANSTCRSSTIIRNEVRRHLRDRADYRDPVGPRR